MAYDNFLARLLSKPLSERKALPDTPTNRLKGFGSKTLDIGSPDAQARPQAFINAIRAMDEQSFTPGAAALRAGLYDELFDSEAVQAMGEEAYFDHYLRTGHAPDPTQFKAKKTKGRRRRR